MRLDSHIQKIIKQSILHADENAEVYLYGSRTDDSKKGGDIDILVISDKISLNEKLKILNDIFSQIEEQKIDLLIAKNKNESAFVKYILKHAIPL